MARGFAEQGCRIYAVLNADVENMHLWQQLPNTDIIAIRLSDHYKGVVGAVWRFLMHDIRRLKKYFKSKRVDTFYIPMVHPLSLPVLSMFRRKGVPTFFTFHDVKPHVGERTLHYLPIHRAASRLASKADVVTLLTGRFKDYVARKYRAGKRNDIIITPHPVFNSYNECAIGEKTAPITAYNFLFFGRIVRYKGLDILADAYRRLSSERDDVSLRIVGSGDFTPYAEQYASLSRVTIDNRFIPDSEVISYFRMPGTIVVLPYTEASQSGIIPIAMSEQAQLVVTNLDGLMEQTENGSLAIVAEPTADSLYMALKKSVLEYDALANMRNMAKKHISTLTWKDSAANILNYFYR